MIGRTADIRLTRERRRASVCSATAAAYTVGLKASCMHACDPCATESSLTRPRYVIHPAAEPEHLVEQASLHVDGRVAAHA